MEKREAMMTSTKRHTNKQQQSQSASSGGRNLIPPATAAGLNASRGDLQFSEKSKKEKVRSLSAVAKALSMGCRVSHSLKPTNKFKLPRKLLKDCNGVDHASVPRKIRSAVKKRGRESIFGDSEKVNHGMNGMESPKKDGIKKSKKQRTQGWSTRQVLIGPITKDEEEVVETLYALAGMFPADKDNGSNVKSELDTESLPENSTVLQDQEESQISANATFEASGATQYAGERSPRRGCKRNSSLNETIGQQQTDFPQSAKFLVATHSTAPKINLQAVPMMVKSENGSNVALHDAELSLEMGLNVPTPPQISHIGRQSDVEFQTVGSVDYKQEHQLIKYPKETGLALWPGLSPIASAGIASASYLQSSSPAKAQDWLNTAIDVSKQDLMESCSSGGKSMQISEIITHKKSWKRCEAHVHISHLIRSLEASKRQVGKEHKLCLQTRVQQGSKCGVLNEARNLNWMRSGNSYATRTVHSANYKSNSRETKNGILQHGLYHHDIYHSQAPPTPGVYGPQKQCFNFLSLSTGGSELKVNESFNKGESKLEPYSKSQLPYFQSLQQQQQQHGFMAIQSSPYDASTFLDQLHVAAGPQVRLLQQQQQQQAHYYGTPLRGTQYSSTVSSYNKQQHQSFWAVQVAAQGMRAQYPPNWQSVRHDSAVADSPASLETLGSKITSSSRSRAIGQDILHLASSSSSVCEESQGRFRSSGTPSLQLLCDERI